MKNIQIPAALSLCAAGFLFGRAAHHLFARQTEVRAPEAIPLAAEFSRGLQANPNTATHNHRPQVKPTPSSLKSTDTLETLVALDDKSLYARLALWMVDASEQDIAAYWQSYRQKTNRDNDINDLIFINWTRLNPAGAIAAATGTKDEHYAWWAWSCHDPKAALTAAIAQNPDRINNVTWGIGEFHPEWLREHYDEIPESGRDNAFEGLAKWDDHSDPLEILRFLKGKGRGVSEGLFQTLAKRDPWAAYDWIQENRTRLSDPFRNSSDLLEGFIKTVGESNPEVLQRIAEQTPAGEMKRKFEAAVFDSLVKSDPEEAMKQALETKAPLIAAERLAKVGMGLVSTDPDKAFELAGRLLESSPYALESRNKVETPGCMSYYGVSDQDPGKQFITALLEKDPDQVMDLCLAGARASALTDIGNMWAQQDVKGFAEWVDRQSDPKTRESAAGTLVNQLQNQHQYAEAIEWAMLTGNQRYDRIQNLLRFWNQEDPEQVGQWFETSDLPEDRKRDFRKHLEKP